MNDALFLIESEICQKINALWDGTLDFKYGNLMSAMKPGHPGDILNDITLELEAYVFSGNIAPEGFWERKIQEYSDFQDVFGVDLSSDIKALKEYAEEA